MYDIKILDSTLRDGGYVNNWLFGFNEIKSIIENLNNAQMDYIEVGFLKDCEYDKEKSSFNQIEDVNNIISKFKIFSKFAVMVDFGHFDQSKIIPKTSEIKLDSIRVTFKKHEVNDVLSFLNMIKRNGYELFVNPANIDTYSDEELLELIRKINAIKPYGFTIVDTTGALEDNNILKLYSIIDRNLDKDVVLGFHSHNNLQLSFSNAQCLMKINKARKLLIDSTIFGMGRGAGNLCTELLIDYVNEHFNGSYNIVPILQIIDKYINPIFFRTPWGYSVSYCLAAKNHCHPNYVKYMLENDINSVETINKFLKLIPNNKKSIFDLDFIRNICNGSF